MTEGKLLPEKEDFSHIDRDILILLDQKLRRLHQKHHRADLALIEERRLRDLAIDTEQRIIKAVGKTLFNARNDYLLRVKKYRLR